MQKIEAGTHYLVYMRKDSENPVELVTFETEEALTSFAEDLQNDYVDNDGNAIPVLMVNQSGVYRPELNDSLRFVGWDEVEKADPERAVFMGATQKGLSYSVYKVPTDHEPLAIWAAWGFSKINEGKKLPVAGVVNGHIFMTSDLVKGGK